MDKFFERLLADREIRASRQESLIRKYDSPIVSYMLNSPGRQKKSPKLVDFHNYGFGLIKESLGSRILESQYYDLDTGMYYLIAVNMDILDLKKLMVGLEDSPAGRLFDIDVFSRDGRQLSRTELGLAKRKCLLCNRPAKECIVGKRHSYKDLVEEMYKIIDSICQF